MGTLARHQSPSVAGHLSEFRIVTIVGARQVGKTTLVKELIETDSTATYMSLDSVATRNAATADPEGFVASARGGTTAIDEIQRAPELLLAIKQRVDDDNRRGQFLLTGSADLRNLSRVPDTLPGRNVFTRLHGLSQAEIASGPPGFEGGDATILDILFRSQIPSIEMRPAGIASLGERLARGSFPEACLGESSLPTAFFDSYIDALLGHEVDEIARIDSKFALRQLISQIAARTSGLLSMTDVGRDIGVSQHTVERYVRTLLDLFVVERLPAWSTNIDQRQVRMPKYYVADPGLHAHLVGVDPRTPDMAAHGQSIGGLFETFVVTEVLKVNSVGADSATPFHYRDRDGHEVDLVLERRDGSVIGIEVKTSSAVEARDFRGLRKLKDRIGDRFKAGVVVSTGHQTVPFGENLSALPVSALWQ